jgi:hypothetical protein
MLSDHEALTSIITQDGTLTSHSLGDKRLLTGRIRSRVQDGRMELDKLQIGHGRTRTQSHGHSVTSCHGRIRRHAEDLADPSRGQHDNGRQHCANSVSLTLSDDVEGDALNRTELIAIGIEGKCILDHLNT